MQPSSCAKARPRPSPFREAQKGGVLGALRRVLPSNFCLKGSARATPECSDHPVGRAKVMMLLHTNPSLAPQ
jgi:hypothetical protein